MTFENLNQLVALLIEYDLKELKPVEKTAIGDRDFDTLKSIYKVQGAIQTILEFFQEDWE